MPSSIGLRIYRVTINKKGHHSSVAFDAPELGNPLHSIISEFLLGQSARSKVDDNERSWKISIIENNGLGTIKGYIDYGTFGFESRLVSIRTGTTNYQRQIDDIEEVPLYFEFWAPSKANFGFVAMQSFQGRSCIVPVLNSIRKFFETKHPSHRIVFEKVMPNNVKGSLYYSQPVKKLRLIRRKTSTDAADQVPFEAPANSVDFEVAWGARPRSTLGKLGELIGGLHRNAAGIVIYNGMMFEEAVAEINVGGRPRRVGIIGPNTEAGVIDLTEMIERGPDGHPTFESMATHTAEIIEDFRKTLSGSIR